METKAAKNITHKTGGVDPRDVNKDGTPLFMVRLSGIVEDVKTFEDRTGTEKTKFIGDFVAQTAGGETYTSDVMYLFRALEDKLKAAFQSGEGKALEFGYDVSAIFDSKSATRYVYAAKGLTPTATHDRMAELAKRIGDVPMPGAEKVEKPATGKAHK